MSLYQDWVDHDKYLFYQSQKMRVQEIWMPKAVDSSKAWTGRAETIDLNASVMVSQVQPGIRSHSAIGASEKNSDVSDPTSEPNDCLRG